MNISMHMFITSTNHMIKFIYMLVIIPMLIPNTFIPIHFETFDSYKLVTRNQNNQTKNHMHVMKNQRKSYK